MPTPQNGQTHSNNLLTVFDHFVGLALKGLNTPFAENCHAFSRAYILFFQRDVIFEGSLFQMFFVPSYKMNKMLLNNKVHIKKIEYCLAR